MKQSPGAVESVEGRERKNETCKTYRNNSKEITRLYKKCEGKKGQKDNTGQKHFEHYSKIRNLTNFISEVSCITQTNST